MSEGFSKGRGFFQSLTLGVVRGAYRLLFRPAPLLAPAPAGSSAGWGLGGALTAPSPLFQRPAVRPENVFSQHLEYGWTVWDCVPGQGDITLDIAQAVGAEGLVVAFSPKQDSFRTLNERASQQGYSNILFLYASVVSGERMVSDALTYNKGLRLSEVLMDEDIPKPEMLRLAMPKKESDLEELIFICRRVRPHVILEEIAPELKSLVWQFAESQNYTLVTEKTGEPIPSKEEIPFRALLVPAEKKSE